MLKGKCVVVGVCGGIAAYKACSVVSALSKLKCDVHVVMTKAAEEFVGELTFRTLSKNPVYDDMFGRPERWEVEHVELAKKADLIVICPATANTIAKLAYGMADDPLGAVCLASRAQKLICPAMNTGMYENEAVTENMRILKKRGFKFVLPESGMLACGDVGKGRMAEPEKIVEAVLDEIACQKDLLGKKVLVTAGPTQEDIDPVRYITNHSTGKMGYAIAKAARMRGAFVYLVSGKTALEPVFGAENIYVKSAKDMYDAVLKIAPECDIIIKAAAVADFTPVCASDNKIKKSGEDSLEIKLKKTDDILFNLGKTKREDQVLVGFCMETQSLLESAEKKLKEKNCDFIVANNLFDKNAGFAADNNTVTILFKDGQMLKPENMAKEKLAHIILNEAVKLKDKQE